MNQVLRIIQFLTYLGGAIGLAVAVIVRLAGLTFVTPRGALVFAIACFLCTLATRAVAAELQVSEEVPKQKAAAA